MVAILSRPQYSNSEFATLLITFRGSFCVKHLTTGMALEPYSQPGLFTYFPPITQTTNKPIAGIKSRHSVLELSISPWKWLEPVAIAFGECWIHIHFKYWSRDQMIILQTTFFKCISVVNEKKIGWSFNVDARRGICWWLNFLTFGMYCLLFRVHVHSIKCFPDSYMQKYEFRYLELVLRQNYTAIYIAHHISTHQPISICTYIA